MPSPAEIFVFLPNWIGDVVMATPTLRALRKRFAPPRRIVGVMRPYVASILNGVDWLDESILFDRKAKGRDDGFWSLVRLLRSRRPETAVILPSSFLFGAAALLAGVPRRIGYAKNLRGWTLTDSLRPRRAGDPNRGSVVEHYLRLAYAAGCDVESPEPELRVFEEDERGADRVWTTLGLDSVRHVVLLNPGSTHGDARNWPPAHFVELARRLVAAEADVAALVLCGPAERVAAAEISRGAAHPRVVDMSGQDMALGVALACIRRASLLVTGDNGPRHLAAALARPVVCLAGPTDTRWTFSHNPREIQLRLPLSCSPCGKHDCPLGHKKCMTDLTVEQVLAAVRRSLTTASGEGTNRSAAFD